jgi:phosphoglycolate phosphatase-like HAD superfamily hydrolase
MNASFTLHPVLSGRQFFVFDLDGTLTQAVHDFEWIRDQLGVPPKDDILGYIASLPHPIKAQKKAHLDELEWHFARQAKAELFAVEAIKQLFAMGATLGILTRNTKEIAHETLSVLGILHCFDPGAILGRDEAIPKPDADGLIRIAKRWAVKVEHLVMVGDFRFDLETGRNANAVTVHVHSDRDVNWPDLTDLRILHLGELFNPILDLVE